MNQLIQSRRGVATPGIPLYIYEIRQSILKQRHTRYMHKLLRFPQMTEAPSLPQLPLQLDQKLLT